MTDDRRFPLPPDSHRARPRRRSPSRVATIKATVAALAAAGVITAGLAAQMAAGHDPALGAGQTAKASSDGAHTQPEQSPSDAAATSAPAPDPVVTAAS